MSKLRKLSFGLAGVLLAFTAIMPVLAASSRMVSSSTEGASTAAGVMIILVYGFICLVGVLSVVIPVVALGITVYFIIDASRRDFGPHDDNQLLLWILILVFAGFPIGTLIYYLMVTQKYPLK